MEVFIAACGGALVAGTFGLITVLLQRKWNKNDKSDEVIDALKVALKVMMLDRVQHLGRAYIKAGAVDFDDRFRLHQMHDAYKQLGGNGDLNLIMGAVDKLKLKEN